MTYWLGAEFARSPGALRTLAPALLDILVFSQKVIKLSLNVMQYIIILKPLYLNFVVL